MRRITALFAISATLIAGRATARAALPAHVDLRAAEIALYLTEPPVLAASGTVTAHFGKYEVRANGLRYDLQHNRIVAAGDVAVVAASATLPAAACTVDLDSNRATLLRLDGELPATYVITLSDPAALEARPPKPGEFDIAALDGLRPFVRARHAVVTPNANVRFANAHVLTETGASLPSPSYLYSFASNPSFAQSSLPGASFDQPYPLLGTPTSLLAAHLRFDTTSGRPGLGLDEHLVNGNRAYLIASALPTSLGIVFDVTTYRQLTPTLGESLILSHGGGIGFGQYQLQSSNRSSTTTLLLQQNGGFQTADLRLSTLGHEIPRIGYYKFALDVGYDHAPGMQPAPSDTRAGVEAHYSTPNLRGPLGTTISSSVDLATTIFDFPRERGSSRVYASISRRITPALSLFGSVQFLQTYDRYGSNQSYYYPPTPPVLWDGSVYYGYGAFAGASTFRAYSLQATYSPSPALNLVVSAVRERDWPQFDGYGNPPLGIGFDIRIRPPRGPAFEFGRTFVFGWGGKQWSPAYTFNIAP